MDWVRFQEQTRGLRTELWYSKLKGCERSKGAGEDLPLRSRQSQEKVIINTKPAVFNTGGSTMANAGERSCKVKDRVHIGLASWKLTDALDSRLGGVVLGRSPSGAV